MTLNAKMAMPDSLPYPEKPYLMKYEIQDDPKTFYPGGGGGRYQRLHPQCILVFLRNNPETAVGRRGQMWCPLSILIPKGN